MAYTPLPNPLPVGFSPGTIDTFGGITTGHRNLQINDQFIGLGTLSNVLTLVTSGGGTGVISSGVATYSTSTATTAQAQGTSRDTTTYLPGCEVFAEFSATFTTPTSAASYQRVGLYNTTDGFYIGYAGTTFGIGVRNASSDTPTTKANWNLDTLTGAATSKFTRNGVPEAIDFTNLNVFRIRFGWLGAAPICFEVLSPDGDWVTFHKIRQPNTIATPSVQTPNLPLTIDVSKTAANATNLVMTCACWGAGIVNGTTALVPATYSATSAIAFTAAATPTDIFTIYGSATRTIKILRIGFSATQTTAATANIVLIKRSAANTGGTIATATSVPHDAADPTATATIVNYTANATALGAAVGTVKALRAYIPAPATATPQTFYEIIFGGNNNEKPIILRGTSQGLAINLNSTTITGNLFTCWVEYTEE